MDIYSEVTARIMEQMEQGIIPWQKPWIASGTIRNSAAYIQNWLNVLKSDKRFIISAAGKAEKAVQLILN